MRTEDTRQAILDAAVALYLSRGTENTTVSAIIGRARLSRTTFYRYFKDADDVLNKAVLRDFDAVLADFATQRIEHSGLEEQIVEDIVWFIHQFRHRPALKLVFADNSRQLYERLDDALATCFNAALACTQPTFERARRQGRLRDGVTLHKYVEWCMFIVMSLQTVNFPVAANEFRLREMVKDFVAPSLIMAEQAPAAAAPVAEPTPLFGRRPSA
jgi:AcrR family transcriptional regulator